LIANDSYVHNMPVFIAGCLFSAFFLQGVGIELGLLLQRVLQLRVYRYAGLAMPMATVIIGLFPSVNDFMINLIEKSGHEGFLSPLLRAFACLQELPSAAAVGPNVVSALDWGTHDLEHIASSRRRRSISSRESLPIFRLSVLRGPR
jgi:hypothetical protein